MNNDITNVLEKNNMIPQNLKNEHYLKAIEEIDSKGIPHHRASVRYDLLIRGKKYPPKYVISIANKYANKSEWPSSSFNAVDAKDHFIRKGYTILDRKRNEIKIPKLDPISRKREYNSYDDEFRSLIVKEWLFGNKTHRELDRDILELDPNYSRGYQSMGILHYLGLKKEFHGLFNGLTEDEAIDILETDNQNFNKIISFIKKSYQDTSVNLNKLKNEENNEIEASYQDTSDARLKRITLANTKPQRIRVYSSTYKRNPDIVVEALIRADGYCEECRKPAPFLRSSDGTPYLEIHHVVALADRGEDTLENVQALCPNCHKKKHYG